MKTLEEVKHEYLSQALSRPIKKYYIKNHAGRIVIQGDSPVVYVFNNEVDDAYAAEHYKLKEIYNGMKFWWGIEAPKGLFQSAGGGFYTEAELPENNDEFCIQKYSNEVKAERNARIADTDDYVRLYDMTVQKSANAKRSSLNEDDKEELLAYRQALRDLPEKEGFPFIEFPAFPSVLTYELSKKAQARKNERTNMDL